MVVPETLLPEGTSPLPDPPLPPTPPQYTSTSYVKPVPAPIKTAAGYGCSHNFVNGLPYGPRTLIGIDITICVCSDSSRSVRTFSNSL